MELCQGVQAARVTLGHNDTQYFSEIRRLQRKPAGFVHPQTMDGRAAYANGGTCLTQLEGGR
jgi:hypothetical protein